MDDELIKNIVSSAVKAFFDSLFEHVKNPFKKIKYIVCRFGKKERGIIFAFPKEILSDSPLANEPLEIEEIKQINLLHHNLENDISKYKIKIKRLENKQIPTNHEDAVALLKKSKAALVIWGNVVSGNVKTIGNSVTDIKELKFTFSLNNLSAEDKEILTSFIGLSILGKLSRIDHKNDKEDRENIARNIKNTSCYAVAMVLALNKRFIEANKIFNQLEADIIDDLPSSQHKEKFLETVKVVHAYSYLLECNSLGFPAIPSLKLKQKIEKLTESIEKTSGYIKSVYTNKSIINFWNRDIDSAISCLELAQGGYLNYFNKAFLFYYKSDIYNGWINLKRAIKIFLESERSEEDFIIKQERDKFIKNIIKFYKDVVKKEKSSYLLLFPLSYIIYKLVNKKSSIKYSKKLLKNISKLNLKTENEKRIFMKKAQRMINGLE